MKPQLLLSASVNTYCNQPPPPNILTSPDGICTRGNSEHACIVASNDIYVSNVSQRCLNNTVFSQCNV